MIGFRTTKYDPKLRSPNGAYARDEWTSVTDVGRVYLGRAVELSDYRSVEEAYVETARRFLAQSQIRCLRIMDLESKIDNCDLLPSALVEETRAQLDAVEDGRVICDEHLEWVIRLVLREVIWCRLESEKEGFYIHFGYDYYMYIGSSRMRSHPPTLPRGMFAELFESPYHREESDD